MSHPAWRRVRRHFSISAPRMAVRTHLSWPWRAVIVLALVGLVGGMWWWGYDFGQIFGGFHRQEIEAELATVRADAAKLAHEAAQLRQSQSTLESEIAMARGTQASLSKQVAEVTQENAQLKEELAFLQKLVADSSRQTGVSIPRVSLERGGTDTWNYRVLVVRGGAPKDEFDGHLAMTATLGPAANGAPATISLPADQPDASAALRLRFKYYQRVEGTIRVPPGAEVRSLTVRAYETGASAPRVSRTLALS